jgi:hypothetical protein
MCVNTAGLKTGRAIVILYFGQDWLRKSGISNGFVAIDTPGNDRGAQAQRKMFAQRYRIDPVILIEASVACLSGSIPGGRTFNCFAAALGIIDIAELTKAKTAGPKAIDLYGHGKAFYPEIFVVAIGGINTGAAVTDGFAGGGGIDQVKATGKAGKCSGVIVNEVKRR